MCFGTGCHGRVSHISPILRRLLKAAQPEWSVSCPVTFSLWPWTHHPALFSPLGGVSVPWWEKVSGRAAATQSRLIVWGERRLTCWTAAAWFKLLLFIHLRFFFLWNSPSWPSGWRTLFYQTASKTAEETAVISERWVFSLDAQTQ